MILYVSYNTDEMCDDSRIQEWDGKYQRRWDIQLGDWIYKKKKKKEKDVVLYKLFLFTL